MITIEKTTDYIILHYSSEFGNGDWLAKKLGLVESNNYQGAIIAHTFQVTKDLYISDPNAVNYSDNEEKPYNMDFEDQKYSFIIAKKTDEYYRFDKDVLNIDFYLYMHESIELNQKSFIQYRNVSVFRKINSVYLGEEFYVGGPKATISGEYFDKLLSYFPNSYEVDRYIDARIASILRNEIGTIPDYVNKHEDYINKKIDSSKKVNSAEEIVVLENDVTKFELYIGKLKNMLEKYVGYSEKDWQTEIVKIFRIVYPKYIQTLGKMHIKDFLTGKDREIDIALIDASGYIDIVEIKKPQATGLLYQGLYRNNYVPVRELQGTVMQVENYILSLIKMGVDGENKINKKYSNLLNIELQMKVINPKGIIIMGIEEEMNEKQKNDFEVVKRMYNNVIDIITYDELLKRLENIYSSLKSDFVKHEK